MKRKIINIDEEKCTGCGLCIPECPEGAIQIIDDKARLVSDLFCDGLGACIGHCPEGAITVEEREAEPYDERKVMENIARQGENTIRAHLRHLLDHGETDYYSIALDYLSDCDIRVSLLQEDKHMEHVHTTGCPGAQSMSFADRVTNHAGESDTISAVPAEKVKQESQLSHWPIQMHLLSPLAVHYRSSDLLLAADCVAFSLGDFHAAYLKERTLAVACPKLDTRQEVYLEKLVALIDVAEINTITVMIMQVPCCSGLLHMAEQAVQQARRKVPVKVVVVSLDGRILREEWT
jgi:ferredoxin